MKKGFLFGLGILFAGITFAAILNIPTKGTGDVVTATEFNQVTTSLNSLQNSCNGSKILKGFSGNGTGPLSFQCVDDQTGSGSGVTAKTCNSGKFMNKVDGNGKFTCETPSGGSGFWGDAGSNNIKYMDGNVGINAGTPVAKLDIEGTVVANRVCLATSGVGNTDAYVSRYSIIEDTSTKGAVCFDESTLKDLSNLIDQAEDGTLIELRTNAEPCVSTIAGKTRVSGSLDGLAELKYQVCMRISTTWGWYTLLSSDTGIPSSGIGDISSSYDVD